MFITLTNIKNKNGNCHAFWQLPDSSDNLRTIPDSVFEKHILLKKTTKIITYQVPRVFFFRFFVLLLFYFCFLCIKNEIQIKALILVFEFNYNFFQNTLNALVLYVKLWPNLFNFDEWIKNDNKGTEMELKIGWEIIWRQKKS